MSTTPRPATPEQVRLAALLLLRSLRGRRARPHPPSPASGGGKKWGSGLEEAGVDRCALHQLVTRARIDSGVFRRESRARSADLSLRRRGGMVVVEAADRHEATAAHLSVVVHMAHDAVVGPAEVERDGRGAAAATAAKAALAGHDVGRGYVQRCPGAVRVRGNGGRERGTGEVLRDGEVAVGNHPAAIDTRPRSREQVEVQHGAALLNESRAAARLEGVETPVDVDIGELTRLRITAFGAADDR